MNKPNSRFADLLVAAALLLLATPCLSAEEAETTSLSSAGSTHEAGRVPGADSPMSLEALEGRWRAISSGEASGDRAPALWNDLLFLERRLREQGADETISRRIEALRLALRRALGPGSSRSPAPAPEVLAAPPPLRRAKADPVALQGADHCQDAPVIDFVAGGSLTGTTLGASVDGDTFCEPLGISPDVWYRLEVPDDAKLFADTMGSGFDTVISLHAGCPGSSEDFEHACNDDGGDLDGSSELVEGFFSSASVWLRVSGAFDEAGDYVLNVGPGGRVAGRVLDEAGEPIPNMSVLAANASYGEFGTTGADGRFVIDNLDAGFYNVVVDADFGYVGEAYPDILCLPEIDCLASGQLVEVAFNETTELADMRLNVGAALEGRVVDRTSGEPVVNATVLLERQDTLVLDVQYADQEGNYRFEGLPPGTYYADAFDHHSHQAQAFDGVDCPGFCLPQVGTPIPLELGSLATGIDFDLARLGVIRGSIRDAEGQPLDFYPLALYPPPTGQGFQMFTYSDSDGSFQIGGLQSGGYLAVAGFSFFGPHVRELFEEQPCVETPQGDCDFEAGTVLEVEVDGTVEDIDFTLSSGGIVSGRVVDDRSGAALRNVLMSASVPGFGLVAQSLTDAGGNYHLEGLAGGGYVLGAHADFLPNSHLSVLYPDLLCDGLTCPFDQASTLDVAFEQDTTGIDFTLPRTSTVSGRVTRSGSGEPLVGIEVSAFAPSGSFLIAVSDLDGFYELAGLEPGMHQLEATSSDFISQTRQVTTELGSDLTDVDFVLSAGGRITGVARDRSGQLADGVEIVAYDEQGNFVAGDFIFGAPYQLTRLPPGSYRVQTRGFGDYLDQAWPGIDCPEGCSAEQGQLIAVAEHETIGDVDFELERFAVLSGRAFDAEDGRRLEGAVYLISAGVSLSGTSFTFASDDYDFTGVASGTYHLLMDPFENYVSRVLGGGPCLELQCELPPEAALEISYGDVLENLDFVLERGATVAGEVDSELPSVPVDDQLQVELYTMDGQYAGTAEVQSGRWWIDSLPAGSYRLLIRDLRADPRFLDQVWQGGNCQDGCDLSAGGLATVTAGGVTTGIDFTLTPAAGGECGAGELCLLGDRFRVTARWDTGSAEGTAGAEILTQESGYFYFFDPDNVEVVVKMLDACTGFGHFWVFAAGLTNVEVELTVLDTASGTVGTYNHGGGSLFPPLFDTVAFDTCAAGGPGGGTSAAPVAKLAQTPSPAAAGGGASKTCQATGQAACLGDGRFRVEAQWDTGGGPQAASVVPLTDDTAYLWFFGPDNLEVVLKVLDACSAFGRYWVFAAGLTNVQVDLLVTDTETGAEWTYRNENGVDFVPVADTEALLCQ